MFKKGFFILLSLLLVLSGCSMPENKKSDKLCIVSTVFPSYDFARQIAGDKADIKMLIKPGTEVHTYEPSPQDIIAIQNCDVFVYTGGESDKWVLGILDSIDKEETEIVSMMSYCETISEELKEGMHEGEHGHSSKDEHVWTSPLNAVNILQAIYERIAITDPENADFYTENFENYKNELLKLDKEFEETVADAQRKTVIFADRFPVRYFTERYGLEYYAAFPGCSAEAEPSAQTVAFLINKIKEEKIPAVFYIEMSNMKMADTLCEETGAKKLLFSSCHNVTKEEFENNVTYLDLMRQNLASLKEALN